MSRAVLAAYLACALIWGTTWFAIRISIEPGGYPTMDALALRFVIAAIILVPLAIRHRPWPSGRMWGYLVLAGVLDAAAYGFVYLGEERVPGGVAAVVYGTQPLILALLLSVSRMERITPRHLVGAVVSVVGVAVLFLDRLDVSPNQAVGVLMVMVSAVIATIYSMIMKRHVNHVHGLVSTAIFLAVTAIVLAIVAVVANKPLPWPLPMAPSLALLYLAIVGSVVAFLVYFWLLKKTSLILTSTLVFTYPLVALATDVLFEHDIAMGPRTYLGAAITLAGLVVSIGRRS